MTEVELAIKYLENMVNSQYWSCIENTDDFREIKENILILIKGVKENYISKDKIREKIKELEKQAEEVKNFYKGTYACLDEYLNAKSKIQGYKELLGEEE